MLDFEERVVHAEERSHHDAILQKIHDYVWELIEGYGEAPIRCRIAEIDATTGATRSVRAASGCPASVKAAAAAVEGVSEGGVVIWSPNLRPAGRHCRQAG